MSEIQRYGTLTCDCLRGSPEPQSNGDWVTHADHARIVSELEKKLERTTDLVRHQRGELFNAELISYEEFAALADDSESGQRVARLEGYDAMRKELKTARELLREYREFHYGVRVPSGWRMMCIHEDNRCDLCKRTDAFESSATSAG